MLGMGAVDFLLMYMGGLPATMNSDRCFIGVPLMIFSGGRGTISEPYILRVRKALSGSNIPFMKPTHIEPSEPVGNCIQLLTEN